MLHPIVSGRAPDEIESIFTQIKEDRVANHIAVMVTCNKLLGLVDFEILKSIDAQIGEQFEGFRTLHVKIRHVVRLVEKGAGFLPCTLFISPVCELGSHHRKCVRPYLRIAQQFDWTPGCLQQFFQVSVTHSCSCLRNYHGTRIPADHPEFQSGSPEISLHYAQGRKHI
jgi:hypothetical protein